MHDRQSLSHVRWDCKYHVVIVPKYRRRLLYGKFRSDVGRILRDLCRQKGVVWKSWKGLFAQITCTCVSADCAEVQPRVCDWISEGEERGSNSSGVDVGPSGQGDALLVPWLLREYGRVG